MLAVSADGYRDTVGGDPDTAGGYRDTVGRSQAAAVTIRAEAPEDVPGALAGVAGVVESPREFDDVAS